jgi:hypothetical protein
LEVLRVAGSAGAGTGVATGVAAEAGAATRRLASISQLPFCCTNVYWLVAVLETVVPSA